MQMWIHADCELQRLFVRFLNPAYRIVTAIYCAQLHFSTRIRNKLYRHAILRDSCKLYCIAWIAYVSKHQSVPLNKPYKLTLICHFSFTRKCFTQKTVMLKN